VKRGRDSRFFGADVVGKALGFNADLRDLRFKREAQMAFLRFTLVNGIQHSKP
jgi:hypothetical protein